jgi:HSP20 family protein
MAQIAIERVIDASPKALPIFGEVGKHFEAIERRAFDLFEKRGCQLGHDLEDWIQAERDIVSAELDVVFSPPCELLDEGKEFKAQIAMPGFDAKDVQVSVTQDSIVVKAHAAHNHEQKEGSFSFRESAQNNLFHRLAFPASIDIDKVSASLENGILQVTAPKSAPKKTVTVETKTATTKA